jgi:hypothetical protein
VATSDYVPIRFYVVCLAVDGYGIRDRETGELLPDLFIRKVDAQREVAQLRREQCEGTEA